MSKSHFLPGRAKKIAQGKVNYVVLDGNLEVYSSKNFFEAIQALDSLQRQNPQTEYKFAVTEVK